VWASAWGVEMMELRQRIHAQDGGGDNSIKITELPIKMSLSHNTMSASYQTNN
jgi:hypothetical protein